MVISTPFGVLTSLLHTGCVRIIQDLRVGNNETLPSRLPLNIHEMLVLIGALIKFPRYLSTLPLIFNLPQHKTDLAPFKFMSPNKQLWQVYKHFFDCN